MLSVTPHTSKLLPVSITSLALRCPIRVTTHKGEPCNCELSVSLTDVLMEEGSGTLDVHAVERPSVLQQLETAATRSCWKSDPWAASLSLPQKFKASGTSSAVHFMSAPPPCLLKVKTT